MKRLDLISELYLTGSDYNAPIIVRLPNGDFAHIKDVMLMNGEIVLVTTMDAREAYKS